MKKIPVIFIILFLTISAYTQPGKPIIKNFSSADYFGEDQIWTIGQDDRGVMYFGSSAGLFEFDGISWNTIQITESDNAVVSLDIDEHGRVYIGSSGSFGYLRPNRIGLPEYFNLSEELDSADRYFTEVWNTFVSDDYVYYMAPEGIFRYCNDSVPRIKKLNIIDSLFLMYKANDNIFVSSRESGLNKLNKDKAEKIYGLENVNPWFILDYEEGKYLLGTAKDGLLIYDPTATDTGELISKYKYLDKASVDRADKYLSDNQMYMGAVKISEDHFAIGTISGGIMIINKKGKIIDIIDNSKGIQSNTIHSLFVDDSRELWAALSYGMARIEINSPIRIFDEKSGIPGTIYEVLRYNNILYIATNLGFYYYDGSQFKGIKDFTGKQSVQIFFPYVYEFNTGIKIMFFTTGLGLYAMSGNQINQITELSPSSIYQSQFNKDYIYFTADYSLYMVKKTKYGFSKPLLLQTFEKLPTLGCEENPENIWMFFDKKPVRFNLINKHLKEFKDNSELFDISFFNSQLIANKLIFNTDKGLFRYDRGLSEFVKDTVFAEISREDKPINFIFEVDNNKFLTLSQNYKFSKIAVFDYSSDMLHVDSLPFKRSTGYLTVYNDGDSLIWGVSSKTIYKFQINKKKNYDSNRYTLIRKVMIGEDSVFFKGSFFENIEDYKLSANQTDNFVPKLSYKDNDISFEFIVPEFDDAGSNEYSYLLVGGKSDKWSKWTGENFKEYTNLHEGKYIFNVKGRNIYGIEAEIAEFKFVILAPWYRAWWAFILYILLLSLFIWGLVKLNARRLQNENIRLDKIVKERTAEILLQKEEIQTQADHLEQNNVELSHKNEEISSIAENLRIANHKIKEKNVYITDSINYAKRIQTAVLPSDKEISSIVKDYFILYKPKDIVGGDFYYFKKIKEYVIFAVADCTGHGVPGGFLSMMGISLLNDILLDPQILSASNALEEMRMRVKNALRQTNYLTGRTDGIDIALCVVDKKKKILQFSGANIAAVVIRNKEEKEVIELKADQQPIGIHYKEKAFTITELDLDEGDMIYLFTDGYYDQFGGKNNKKFLLSNLKELLAKYSHESVKIQRREILNAFNSWKGDKKQVDDILLLGVKNVNLIDYSE